jgi:hypothetical protein
MAYRWYVRRPDCIDGPFTSNDVRQQASDGRIVPETRVSRDGQKWVKASQIRGLEFNTLPSTGIPGPASRDAKSADASSAATRMAPGVDESSVQGLAAAASNSHWVMIDGTPAGPFGHAELRAKVDSGEIATATPTCPFGGSRWVPLGDISGFGPASLGSSPAVSDVTPHAAHVVPAHAALPTPVWAPSIPSVGPSNPLTNPRLPQVANWICIYTLLASPFLWFISNARCMVTGTTYPEGSNAYGLEILLGIGYFVLGFFSSVLLFFGGLKLRALDKSGVDWLRGAYWFSILNTAVFILLHMILFIVFVASADVTYEEPGETMTLFEFAALVIGVADLAFEIFSLVWLTRNRDLLRGLNADG